MRIVDESGGAFGRISNTADIRQRGSTGESGVEFLTFGRQEAGKPA